jgi:hypothetical protein
MNRIRSSGLELNWSRERDKSMGILVAEVQIAFRCDKSIRMRLSITPHLQPPQVLAGS